MCGQSASGSLLTEINLSSICKPAASAGPPATTLATVSVNCAPTGTKPKAVIGEVCSGLNCHAANGMVVLRTWPLFEVSSNSVLASPMRPINAKLTSSHVRTFLPSIAVISEPGVKPACAAGLLGSTSSKTGLMAGTPIRNINQNAKMANKKFAIGPATTIAIRAHTDLWLNAWPCIASGTSSTRPSSILTYPPSGIIANTYSVPSRPTRRQIALPKPIEKRSTLTPLRLATQKWPYSCTATNMPSATTKAPKFHKKPPITVVSLLWRGLIRARVYLTQSLLLSYVLAYCRGLASRHHLFGQWPYNLTAGLKMRLPIFHWQH